MPSEKIIWASGSKGMIARSTDEGKNFDWFQVKGFEKRDFRAMHAWNDQEAIIVAVAAPAIVLKTKDGGKNWYQVYENKDTAMFLDAVLFKDAENGTIVGDPISNVPFLLTTKNRGESWSIIPPTYFSDTLKKGEAFFASSNSNLVQVDNNLWIVTGGISSRLWFNGKALDLPLLQGRNSTGANSIAISPDHQKLVIVGGDFSDDKKADDNIVGYKLTQGSTSSWQTINIAAPSGYKSCVEFINNLVMISCGTSGVDISLQAGDAWQKISEVAYHVVKRHVNKNGAFLAGPGGRISYIQFQ